MKKQTTETDAAAIAGSNMLWFSASKSKIENLILIIMKFLNKLFYQVFKRYNVLERKFVTYNEADKMIKTTCDKPESEKWVLAKEEDTNKFYGMVYLCRKVRIYE